MPRTPNNFIVIDAHERFRIRAGDIQHVKNFYAQPVSFPIDEQRNVYQLVGSFKMVEKPAPSPAIGDRFETRGGQYVAIFTGKNRHCGIYYFVLVDKANGVVSAQTPRYPDGRYTHDRELVGDVIGLPKPTSSVEFVPVAEVLVP